MLHIHFGAGRLGLGLVAPYFRTTGTELHILNRARSGIKATGDTALSAGRRNELLKKHPQKMYIIQPPGDERSGEDSGRENVHYDGFAAYDDASFEARMHAILDRSTAREAGVIVTASVLKPENYRAILKGLHVLALAHEGGRTGPLYLVACENTLLAQEVLDDGDLDDAVTDEIRSCVTCVPALVDRMCVGLEEDRSGAAPAVLVRAERFGSLKLQLAPETERLVALLNGSRVEFSRHVETEKQIKSWLLNGSHSLIALAAFSESEGNRDLMLNEFLGARPERLKFAESVMREMQDGVAAILKTDPRYASFVADVDPDEYLAGASQAILRRFLETRDPITRILARFQAPSANSLATIEAFSKRFADRVGGPLTAYQADHGVPPPASTQSVLSLVKLLANGTFIDTRHA